MGIIIENGWFGTGYPTELTTDGATLTALTKAWDFQLLALLSIIVEIVLLLP
jgi:hypothetical protein